MCCDLSENRYIYILVSDYRYCAEGGPLCPSARRPKMGMNCGNGSCGSGRNFLTKQEKKELLEEYKENLESELNGVSERIKELAKE